MKKRKTYFVLVGLLVATVLGGVVLAQVSDNYDLSWHVISGGGGPMSSTSYSMNSTIGQAVIGSKSSTKYQLGSGYWPGGIVEYLVRLPIILRNYMP